MTAQGKGPATFDKNMFGFFGLLPWATFFVPVAANIVRNRQKSIKSTSASTSTTMSATTVPMNSQAFRSEHRVPLLCYAALAVGHWRGWLQTVLTWYVKVDTGGPVGFIHNTNIFYTTFFSWNYFLLKYRIQDLYIFSLLSATPPRSILNHYPPVVGTNELICPGPDRFQIW